MKVHEIHFRVRYAETDQMGVVYYANYFIWMEMGRVEYCRAAGMRYRDMERDDGVLLTVAGASCRYLYPARYDEESLVRTWIAEVHPRMVRFAYEISNAEAGGLLAKGETKHVFCGPDMKPCKLPAKYRPLFGLGD